MYESTAAHKLLPMNTMLLVTNLENGREAVVRVNDRGPFVRGRLIDLSYGIAKNLGIISKGTAQVNITALAPENKGLDIAATDFNTGEFYVQIGAFTDKNNALRLQKRFTDAGHMTIIQTYSAPKTIYYRVHVYVGSHLQHAKRAEQALLDRGYSGAFIIAR
jgi:rare lipoprotein A